MSQLKLGKNALILSIMTLLTTLSWVGFDVYWTSHKTTITPVTQKQMKPLEPALDQETIESLKNTLSFSGEELDTIPIRSPESTQAATPTPE